MSRWSTVLMYGAFSAVILFLVGFAAVAVTPPAMPDPAQLCAHARERMRLAEQMPDTPALHEQRRIELDEATRLVARWC